MNCPFMVTTMINTSMITPGTERGMSTRQPHQIRWLIHSLTVIIGVPLPTSLRCDLEISE